MKRAPILLVAAAVLLGGCASTVTDPSQAATQGSTADFLFHHGDLQAYLQSRRDELARLDGTLRSLDQTLLVQLGQLARIKGDLVNAVKAEAVSAAERREIEAEVSRLQVETDAAYKAVLAAEREKTRLTQVDVTTKAEVAQDEKALEQLGGQVSTLQKQDKVLTASVERVRNMRAIQILRQDLETE